MEQNRILKYLNPELQIALAGWRTAYLLYPESEQLLTEVYKGKLVYRKRDSSKRYSYQHIRKNLVKKQTIIKTEPLPF